MSKIFINSQKRGRKQILVFEAALDVFAEFGFRKAGMEDIAKRLGLAVGTLYRYARDKQDLYRKSVKYAFELWQAAAEAAAEASADPLERFRLLCNAAFRHLAGEPRLRRILAGDPALFPVVDAEDPFASINQRSTDILEKFIRDGMEAGAFDVPDPRMAARILFSLYQLFIEKAYVEEESDEFLLFERSLDLVLNGLRARDPRPVARAADTISSDKGE